MTDKEPLSVYPIGSSNNKDENSSRILDTSSLSKTYSLVFEQNKIGSSDSPMKSLYTPPLPYTRVTPQHSPLSSFHTLAEKSRLPIVYSVSIDETGMGIRQKDLHISSIQESGSNILFEYPQALKPYRTSLNSWFANVFAVAFGFPLDSVKTRLQTYKYNGTWHCIVDTYKNEGVMGFYRGLMAPLISSSLMRSWSMSIFTYSKPFTYGFWSHIYTPPPLIRKADKNVLEATEKNDTATDTNASTVGYVMRQLPVSLSSGSLAGITTSFIASPFELTKLGSQIELVIKRRQAELDLVRMAGQSKAPTIVAATKVVPPLLQNQTTTSEKVSTSTQPSKPVISNASVKPKPKAPSIDSAVVVSDIKPSGTFQIARKLVRNNGWTSLYSGYRYMLVRDAIGSGVYFGVYDSIRTAISLLVYNTPEPRPLSVAIAGGLSGAFSWIVIYPLDTIKSRYQRDIMAHVFSKSALRESIESAVKRGLIPENLSPSAAITAATEAGVALPKVPQYPTRPKIDFKLLFNRKMYRGLGISLLRTSVLGMTMFSVYEKLMQITA